MIQYTMCISLCQNKKGVRVSWKSHCRADFIDLSRKSWSAKQHFVTLFLFAPQSLVHQSWPRHQRMYKKRINNMELYECMCVCLCVCTCLCVCCGCHLDVVICLQIYPWNVFFHVSFYPDVQYQLLYSGHCVQAISGDERLSEINIIWLYIVMQALLSSIIHLFTKGHGSRLQYARR